MTSKEFIKEHIEQLEEAYESVSKLDLVEVKENVSLELEYFRKVLKDLEVLDILKKHAHSSYKKTYMYEGPVIPTNEGKLMGWVLHSIGVLILNSDKNFNKVKECLENDK